MLRQFHIVANPVRIVVNTFGDHDPDGMIYVLKEDEEEVRELVARNPFTPVDLVEPLTLRANVGDQVELLLENRLPFETSLEIQRADSASAPAPPCQPGETQVYRWSADREGVHIFTDPDANLHGLFGALIVEPRGSWWTDPVTGAPVRSGVAADIHNPLLPSFREFVWVFHDAMAVRDVTGNAPVDPATGRPGTTRPVNYRSEPMRNWVRLAMAGVVSPGEAAGPFGEPSTPVLRSHVGDPVKIRVINAGLRESHRFEDQVHQWHAEPGWPDGGVVDSQELSPRSFCTVSPLYGAGGLYEAVGDLLIDPHPGEGGWGVHRILAEVESLKPLAGRPPVAQSGTGRPARRLRMPVMPSGQAAAIWSAAAPVDQEAFQLRFHAMRGRLVRVGVECSGCPDLDVIGELKDVGSDFLQVDIVGLQVLIPFDRICMVIRNDGEAAVGEPGQDPALRERLLNRFGEVVSANPDLFNLFFGLPLHRRLAGLTGRDILLQTDADEMIGRLREANERLMLIEVDGERRTISLDQVCSITL